MLWLLNIAYIYPGFTTSTKNYYCKHFGPIPITQCGFVHILTVQNEHHMWFYTTVNVFSSLVIGIRNGSHGAID